MDRRFFLGVNQDGSPALASTPAYRVEGIGRCAGKPRIWDGLLVVTERASGHIILADASDPRQMRCMHALYTNGSPDLACIQSDCVYIPAGHQGLTILERQ